MRLLGSVVSECMRRGGFSSEFYWNLPEYVVPKSTRFGFSNTQYNTIVKPFHINIYSPPTTNFALSSPIAQECYVTRRTDVWEAEKER